MAKGHDEKKEVCFEEAIECQITKDFHHISMHAIAGINTYQTKRVTGKVKNNPLHIVIDSGSTHNFLGLATTKKLNYDIRKTIPLQVSAANGAKLISSTICKGFTWSLHEELFTSDVMLVSLGSCEMILGV